MRSLEFPQPHFRPFVQTPQGSKSLKFSDPSLKPPLPKPHDSRVGRFRAEIVPRDRPTSNFSLTWKAIVWFSISCPNSIPPYQTHWGMDVASLFANVGASATGSIISKITCYPLDTIAVQYQTSTRRPRMYI